MEDFRPTLTFDLYTSDLPSRIEALVAVMHTFRITMITIHKTLSDRRHLLTTVYPVPFSPLTTPLTLLHTIRGKNSIFQTVSILVSVWPLQNVCITRQVHGRFYTMCLVCARLVVIIYYILWRRVAVCTFCFLRTWTCLFWNFVFFLPSKT